MWQDHACHISPMTYVDNTVSVDTPSYVEDVEISSTPSTGAPHVLVCVHGIRDDGSWGSAAKISVKSGLFDNSITVLSARYDRVSSIGFILGYRHAQNCDDLVTQLHQIRSDYPSSYISVICHSNGTKVFADISRRLEFEIEWIFLCGSVCRVRDAEKFLLRNRQTVNDAGTLDWWPVVAEALRPSLFGATGVGGFHRHPITDRWFRYHHGGGVTLKHINEWIIPTLVTGRVVEVAPIEIGFKKQMPTWLRRFIIIVPLLFLCIFVIMGFMKVFFAFLFLIALAAIVVAAI